ncbi:MAG: hypothetical protein JXA87_11655, partial [Thermoleophilia bacterium]|nr:hypothetical protein [Thermoleophilia bacterium]
SPERRENPAALVRSFLAFRSGEGGIRTPGTACAAQRSSSDQPRDARAKGRLRSDSQIPERRTQSLYADIISDFVAKGTDTVQVTIEGMKPATLRAGLRRALKGNKEVKMAQRGEETYLVRTSGS